MRNFIGAVLFLSVLQTPLVLADNLIKKSSYIAVCLAIPGLKTKTEPNSHCDCMWEKGYKHKKLNEKGLSVIKDFYSNSSDRKSSDQETLLFDFDSQLSSICLDLIKNK